VLDENLTLETLRQFPMVCLPNVGIVSAEEARLLRQYVEGGGNLVITGQSGLFDRLGKPSGKSALAALVGAEPVRRLETRDNWVRFSADDLAGRDSGQSTTNGESASLAGAGRALAGEFRPDWPFLVDGPATIYRPTSAQAIGQLLKPARAKRDYAVYYPLSADVPVGPAMLVNRAGRGRVLTFACSPDCATATSWPVTEARRLFGNAVRYLDPLSRVRIDAPQSVESIVTDDRARRTLRVHLVACQAPPQTQAVERFRPYALPAMIEDLPLYRVAVECREPIIEAHASNPTTRLTLRGRRVEATINDIHEVLVLAY
jgi:hypothetical protein